jgi:preprotein translocase subunit SecD
MLTYSRWQTAAILGVTAFFCLAAVPNVLPARALAALPAWAGRTVPLGYDLQGGAYLQFQVDAEDVRRLKVEALRGDVRKILRDARIGYTGLTTRSDGIDVRIREPSDMPRALPLFRTLIDPEMNVAPARERREVIVAPGQASLSAHGSNAMQRRPALLKMSIDGPQFRLTVTDAAIDERIEQVHRQATGILERRLSGRGMSSNIRVVGRDRIVVELPGACASAYASLESGCAR